MGLYTQGEPEHVRVYFPTFHCRMDTETMSSEVVSEGPMLEPEPVSRHGMQTVQQVADTEEERGMVCEGERVGEGEVVISVHVESSESLLPSTSREVVKPVSVPVEPETVMEGGEEVRVVAADEQHVQPVLKPAEQVLIV